jgi:hypothetical protein
MSKQAVICCPLVRGALGCQDFSATFKRNITRIANSGPWTHHLPERTSRSPTRVRAPGLFNRSLHRVTKLLVVYLRFVLQAQANMFRFDAEHQTPRDLSWTASYLCLGVSVASYHQRLHHDPNDSICKNPSHVQAGYVLFYTTKAFPILAKSQD